MSLTGKIAVVTGAASGIGRASALRLAQDGADIAAMDINADGLKETLALIEAEGRKSLAVPVDLLDRAAIKDAFARVRSELGFVEILHNNAGGSARAGDTPFGKAPPEQWDQVVDLNLRAVADCTREVVNEMKQRRAGRIITTSSEHAFRGGGAKFTDYAAAKAGILGFTRSLSAELAEFQITVNAVCPGIIDTPALGFLSEEHKADVIRQVPMKRMGRPEEIAHVVSFFASPGASFVTGAYLLATGGRTLH